MGKKISTKRSAAKKTGFQRKYSGIFKEKAESGGEVRTKKVKKIDTGSKQKKHSTAVLKEGDSTVTDEKLGDDKKVQCEDEGKNGKKPGKKARFILFVGNLSYTTTKESLEKHFKKAGPLLDVRLLLNAQKEPKGCAFVEYKTSAAMLNALLYHHTTFEDRKINVEMTVGGGGNSTSRKKKIQEKRTKSNELIHKMLVQKKKSASGVEPIK